MRISDWSSDVCSSDLYHQLEPLSSNQHEGFKTRAADTAPFLAKAHAIPITVDEFVACQRFYPIVFSVGENPVPLALMGLNEGINVFVDESGKLLVDNAYVPAYVRRYPFMLARLRQDSDELSLRSEEHTSELQSLMRLSYAVFCLKKKQ